jgi:hypothetical protein
MNWRQIEETWRKLKSELRSRWDRLIDDRVAVVKGKSVGLFGAAESAGGQSVGRRVRQISADDREDRSSFSLHLGP